jgi:glutathione reductase (NADPH)
VLIATGSAPAQDALPGLALAMTSNEVLNLHDVPGTLLVVGSGYIAVEFASILAAVGAQVTQAFRDTLPLRGFDHDLRTRLAQALTERGITLAGGVGLHALVRASSCSERMARGLVPMRRSTPPASDRTRPAWVWHRRVCSSTRAAPLPWTSTAAPPPRVGDRRRHRPRQPHAGGHRRRSGLADSEFGHHTVRVDHRMVASAVFTEPPIATVGLTESDAARLGPVDVYESDFRPVRTAFVGSQARSYMKLVVDGLSDVVLGIHMIETDAPEIVQSLAVAMTCGATKRDFDRTLAVLPRPRRNSC